MARNVTNTGGKTMGLYQHSRGQIRWIDGYYGRLLARSINIKAQLFHMPMYTHTRLPRYIPLTTYRT